MNLIITHLRSWGVKIFFALVALSLLTTRLFAADAAAGFDTGNTLYAQGKYPEAAAAYETVAAAGSANSTLWFNLGNAYFKAGQSGQAIAAYRHAAQLAPRDPDIRANLQFARNRVSGNDSVHPNVWQRGLGTLTINEWTVASVVVLWIWFGLLVAREWRPALRPSLGATTTVAGIFTLLLWAGTGADWLANHPDRTAVVIAHDAAVKTGPIDDSQATFTAKDGTELVIIDQREDWLQVSDNHGRVGWLKKDNAQVL